MSARHCQEHFVLRSLAGLAWVKLQQGKGEKKLPTWSFCHKHSLKDSQSTAERSNIGSKQLQEQMESASVCTDNTLPFKQDCPGINSILTEHLKSKLKLTEHCFSVGTHHHPTLKAFGEFSSANSLSLQEKDAICWSQPVACSSAGVLDPYTHPREEPWREVRDGKPCCPNQPGQARHWQHEVRAAANTGKVEVIYRAPDTAQGLESHADPPRRWHWMG